MRFADTERFMVRLDARDEPDLEHVTFKDLLLAN